MKKYMSVFMLFLRSIIYKAGLVILLVCTAEILSFTFIMQSPVMSLESAVEESFIKYIGAAGFLITALIISRNFNKIADTYTARRLLVSERSIYISQILCSFLFFTLLLSAYILTSFILSGIFLKFMPPEYVTAQTVVLAYYRNRFLHGLMPFQDVIIWIRNFIFLLGSSCAVSFRIKLASKNKISQIAVPLIIIFAFETDIGKGLSIGSGIVFLFILWELIGKEIIDYEED